ncbi:MAG: hypothetical protein LUG18_09660 [Candidatus Azobacteroides sp.]|nr:hypothetical protein [Candidatus Azobacteroides sp.]
MRIQKQSLPEIQFPFAIDELYMSFSYAGDSYQIWVNSGGKTGRLQVRHVKVETFRTFKTNKQALVACMRFVSQLVKKGFKLEFKKAISKSEEIIFGGEQLEQLLETVHQYDKINKIKSINYNPESFPQNKKIIQAVRNGDINVIKSYVEEEGLDLSLPVKTGKYDSDILIKEALKARQVEMMKYIFSVTCRFRGNYSPLTDFAIWGVNDPDEWPADSIELLQQAGYKPYIGEDFLENYYQFAVAEKDRLYIRNLVEDVEHNPAFWYQIRNSRAGDEQKKRAKELLEHGFNPNIKPPGCDKYPLALFFAVRDYRDDIEFIQYLLGKGAIMTKKDFAYYLKEENRLPDPLMNLLQEVSENFPEEEKEEKESREEKYKRKLKEAAENARKTVPQDSWQPHAITEEGKFTRLNKLYSAQIGDMEFTSSGYYFRMGQNYFGVVSEENMKVFHTLSGKVEWKVENYNDYGNGSLTIFDGDIAYVPSVIKDSRSIVAYHIPTGQERWTCKLANTYYQFGAYPIQSEKFICAVNLENGKMVLIDKQKGKVHGKRIALKNPVRKFTYTDLSFWGENIVTIAVNRRNCFVIDLYNTSAGAFEKTIIELFNNEKPVMHHIIGDRLYLLTNIGYMYKIDLQEGKILAKTHHKPELIEEGNELDHLPDYYWHHKYMMEKNGVLHYWLSDTERTFVCRYHLTDDTISCCEINKGIREGEISITPDIFYLLQEDEENAGRLKMQAFNMQGKKLAENPVPEFGGIRYFQVIGSRGYMIQEKGGKYVMFGME